MSVLTDNDASEQSHLLLRLGLLDEVDADAPDPVPGHLAVVDAVHSPDHIAGVVGVSENIDVRIGGLVDSDLLRKDTLWHHHLAARCRDGVVRTLGRRRDYVQDLVASYKPSGLDIHHDPGRRAGHKNL